MEIHYEELSDVTRYLQNLKHLRLEDKEKHFRSYMVVLEQYKKIDASSKILEIGTGTGWFPLLCKLKGLNCKGLDISPKLIEYARDLGRQYGLEPDIELGNVEEHDIGDSDYDVIIASSVFEHIERWKPALERVYKALRPGGAMFWESSNKYSITSGEYPLFFYGMMPDPMRYRFRQMMQGADIMKLGIDFNQFTYPQLRSEFRRVGFTHIYDRIDMAKEDRVSAWWKKHVVHVSKTNSLAKSLSLRFSDVTRFVCIK